jgi:uncharacterized protein YkwD
MGGFRTHLRVRCSLPASQGPHETRSLSLVLIAFVAILSAVLVVPALGDSMTTPSEHAPDAVAVSPTASSTTTTAISTTVAPLTTTSTTTSTTVVPTTTTTTTPTTEPQQVGGYDASAESQLVSLVNNLRASIGIPALAHVGSLHSCARSWSHHMAENIAVSNSVQSAFNALVASSGHYANMVNPTFTEIGSGVWADAGGRVWVTQVFRG